MGVRSMLARIFHRPDLLAVDLDDRMKSATRVRIEQLYYRLEMLEGEARLDEARLHRRGRPNGDDQ